MKPYLKVAGAYLLFGALWILFSDRVAERLAAGGQLEGIYQTTKGLFFVILSAGLIYFLSKGSFEARRRQEEKRGAVTRATVAEAHHILRNYLQQMQLVTMEAENCVDFDPGTLELARKISDEAAESLNRLNEVANAKARPER